MAPFRRNHREEEAGTCRDDAALKPGAAASARAPDLPSRVDLTRIGERQLDQIRSLQRQLQQAQFELVQQLRAGSHHAPVEAIATQVVTPATSLPHDVVGLRLDQQAGLCVGGRQGSVPAYRASIEQFGGRFLHHDGGEEDSASTLNATLVAADLVICQTGCPSHAAYWHVKPHCKRAGKRCVFVDNPSATSLRRLPDALPAATDASTEESPPRVPKTGSAAVD